MFHRETQDFQIFHVFVGKNSWLLYVKFRKTQLRIQSGFACIIWLPAHVHIFRRVLFAWFSRILSGEKTEEYREIKGYWVRRLFDISNMNVDADTYAWALQENIIISRESFFEYQSKGFTHVLFINGYRKDSPRIEKEIESITIGKPKKGLCPDKWLDTEFFIIKFK